MTLHIRLLNEEDLPVVYSILALCGEHMYRTRQLNHWYPFVSMNWFRQVMLGKDIYGVEQDKLLIGTYTLSHQPPSYDRPEIWLDPYAPAMYFSAFAILPSHQGQGIGSWCLSQVDHHTAKHGYRALRFDAYTPDTPLLEFYERQGYQRRGTLEESWGKITFFEKIFPVSGLGLQK